MDNFIKTISAFILAMVIAINAFGNFIGVGDIIPTDPETTVAETTLPETSEDETNAPENSEEILALYNEAVNDAYAARVGFSKERYTDNEEFTVSGALKAFKDLAYSVMNVGEENRYIQNVAKDEWESDVPHHYLRPSTLTADDVTSTVCTEKDGQRVITLRVKNGSSKASATEKLNDSPVDKSGICVGENDKSYFDHKTAPVIYNAIGGTFPEAVIEERSSNAIVKAVVDIETGHLVNITVEFDIAYNIDIGAVGRGEATGTTHIIYKDFVY